MMIESKNILHLKTWSKPFLLGAIYIYERLDEVIHNYIVDLDFYFTPPCWLNPIQHPQVEGPLYAPGCKEHTKE
jgi:hypothetical protein